MHHLALFLALALLAWAWLLPAHAALVAEYRFDESSYSGSAGEALDASGNGRHGQAVGGVSTHSMGRTCRALDINSDSSSSATALSTGIDLSSDVGGTGSISFWYYSTSTDSSSRVLMDATLGGGAQFLIYRDDDSASPSTIDVDLGFVVNSASGAEHSIFRNDALSDGAWWHITVTWKLVAGSGASRIRSYVNGTLMSDASFTVASAGLASGIGTLYIGDNRSSASSLYRAAAGHFDTVRIYNHELSTTEINADRSASPSCTLLHHLELTSTSASGGVGSLQTFTVKACANASCSSTYTGGVSGTVTASGSASASWSSGPAFSIGSGASTTTVSASFSPAGTATLGISGASPPAVSSPALYCGLGVAAASGNSCVFTAVSALHHLRIEHSQAGQGVTCSPVTLTVRACQNADCSTPYTGGVSGQLSITNGTPGISVGWPDTGNFTITAGSSSITRRAHVTKPGTLQFITTAESPAPSNANRCDFGSPECTHTSSSAGFLFDVPHHVAELSNTVTVSAVKTADNSLACTPAFASVSKSINFKCSYANPATGTKPVRVGGQALNASASTAAACDGTGRDVSLSFNASGVATTTVQYADVGQITLSASYTGATVYESGLNMTGSDSFVAQPWYLLVSVPGGTKVAGNTFSATLMAINAGSQVTPNFGRESPAETATLNFVRAKPLGSGAVSGSFSASLGSFVSGAATLSDIVYDEVGRIDITTTLTSGNYLGSGWNTGGGSNLSVFTCASDGGTCNLPAGVLAIVAYGTTTAWRTLSNQSGSLPCNATHFGGDPAPGSSKTCFYLATSGVNSASSGSVGPFIPHHFGTSASQACGSFTYAGQPFSLGISAYNAAGGLTRNYDGSANTSPNFAKTVTLGDAGLGLGSFSPATLAASAFSAGVASASAAYAYSSKQTAPQTLSLRASDSDGVSSAGHTEGSLSLRSGRLRLSNAFGRAGNSLQVPLRLEYWSGSRWLPNPLDSCTSLSATAVALSNPRDAQGNASSASTSVASISLSAGQGLLTLNAATPANTTASFNLALNLGSNGSDASCLGSHPSTTGAGLGWLRSRWGDCASAWAADPAGQVSFGIYSPETRKTIDVRELF